MNTGLLIAFANAMADVRARYLAAEAEYRGAYASAAAAEEVHELERLYALEDAS